jgi:hypothetical protein
VVVFLLVEADWRGGVEEATGTSGRHHYHCWGVAWALVLHATLPPTLRACAAFGAVIGRRASSADASVPGASNEIACDEGVGALETVLARALRGRPRSERVGRLGGVHEEGICRHVSS